MKHIANSLYNRVHNWIDAFGFRLNTSRISRKKGVTTRHYFFETFNFLETTDNKNPEKTKYMCFDAYGEKMRINSLLDLQTAFFENISQLK